jgi:hypothetical protein
MIPKLTFQLKPKGQCPSGSEILTEREKLTYKK